MNEDRNRIMIDRFIQDLVNEVIEEEFGVLIQSGITEHTKSLKNFISSKIWEDFERFRL